MACLLSLRRMEISHSHTNGDFKFQISGLKFGGADDRRVATRLPEILFPVRKQSPAQSLKAQDTKTA
jgi:hypothetical protein